MIGVKAFNVVATFTITDLAVLPWTVRSFRSYQLVFAPAENTSSIEMAASNAATMFHVALWTILPREFSFYAPGACDCPLGRVNDDGLSGGEVAPLGIGTVTMR
jgi:hypothetical protein